MAEHVKDSTGEVDGKKEYFCGFGKCRPKWMQVIFRNSKFVTFILCLNAMIETGLISGKNNNY